MAVDPATEFSVDVPADLRRESRDGAGTGPWRLGLRRLRRNRAALAFGVAFLLMVGTAVAAPLWSKYVAERGVAEGKTTDTVVIDGKETDVVSEDSIPIGPTWGAKYFLGADENGRDVMVRLLYGGRNSLLIGVTAALITTIVAVMLGLFAGYFRGWIDGVIAQRAGHHVVVPGGDPGRRAGRGAGAGRAEDRPDRDRGRLEG